VFICAFLRSCPPSDRYGRKHYLLQDRYRLYMHAGPASANRVPSCFRLEVCHQLATLISCISNIIHEGRLTR